MSKAADRKTSAKSRPGNGASQSSSVISGPSFCRTADAAFAAL